MHLLPAVIHRVRVITHKQESHTQMPADLIGHLRINTVGATYTKSIRGPCPFWRGVVLIRELAEILIGARASPLGYVCD